MGTSLLPLAPLFLTFLIPVVLGAWYGFFGGAFYERWKCRRLAAGVRAD